MILQLDDKHKISSDKFNFVLEKLEDITDRKTGETKQQWKDVGYFGHNLEYALKRYIIEVVRHEDKTDANKLYKKLNDLENTIKTVVKKENIKLIKKEKY